MVSPYTGYLLISILSICPSTICNPTLGSKIISPVPPCVPFYSYCHSALLRWMTRFAAAICDCTIPLNAMLKMSGIQVNDACVARDVFGVLYSGGAIVCCL
jgi:hypothetical protein